MKISFSYILKNKKIVFSVLLFFVAITIFTPTLAHAAWYDRITQSISSAAQGISDNLTSAALASGYSIANFIISFLLLVPLVIVFIISTLSGTLLIWVIEISTNYINYTSLDPSINPVISAGWPIMRDFGNMLIVLMLIVIAVATILRIKSYEAQKLLPRLIVAALLINFSLVICGVFIDLSNVVMRQFLIGSEANAAGNWISTSEIDTFTDIISHISEDPPPVYIGKVAGNILFYMVKAAISFLFVFLFLFRVMALWILVILSPLAFASAIAPFTKSLIFDKWRNNFIQWCLIGAFGALFLYLGNQVNSAITSQAWPDFQVELGDGVLQKTLVNAVTKLAQFFIPGIFLIIGFQFSLSLSAMGASLAVNAFSGSNKLLRQSKWGNKLESGVRQVAGGGLGLLESTGMIQAGSKNTFLNKGNDNMMKPYLEKNKQADNATLIRIATSDKTRNTFAGAAAAQTLVDRKVFETIGNNLPPAEQERLQREAIQNMINRGVDTKKAVENASNNTLSGLAVAGGRTGALAAGTLAERKKFGTIGRDLPPAQQQQTRRETMENMIANGVDVKAVTESSPSLARHNAPAIRELTQTTNPATGRNYTNTEAGDESVRRARRKADLGEIERGEINHELLDETTTQKLRKSAEKMSADKVQAFRDLRNHADSESIRLTADSVAAGAAGNPTLAGQLLAEAQTWERRRDKIDAALP